MSDYIQTTNMSLTVPITGATLGPNWANEINASLVLLDGHDHSSGKGVQINPAGLNINSDLAFANNNATLLRTVRLAPPQVQPALANDVCCVYAFGVDLYYRDGSGNQVRLTQNGSVVGTPGSITNLASPASVSYVGASTSFVFQSDAATSALLDAGSVIIRNATASSKGATVAAPAALAADYTLTLPLKPAALQSVVSIATTGVMTPAAPDSTMSITGSAIGVATGGITATQMAAGLLPPPGSMMAYGGTAAPTGYLLCDGTSYLQATYPALYGAIGNAYGTADGTHFNVPDLRGMFLRGVTGASANDPDAAGRTANNAGGNTGNNVGSQQAGALASHSHVISLGTAGGNGARAQGTNTVEATTTTTAATGGNETRPINVYVNFIIKT